MMGDMINLALVMTAAALVILAVKVLMGTRITPKGHMLMWLVLAAVLVTAPFADRLPESELAARNYVPQVENGIYEAINNSAGFRMTVTGESIESNYLSSLSFSEWTVKTCGIVWAVGSAACLLIFAASYIRSRRKLLYISAEPDEEKLAVFNEVKEAMKIRDNVNLRIGADSTMLAMTGGPTVFLEDVYEGAELRFVLAHELTHYKHGDLIWNLIAALVMCMFWWNPVMWIAFRRFRRDMEVYCDYDAAEAAGDKKGYARVLVRAAAGTGRFIPATTSLIGGEKEVSARVKALAAFRKPKVIAVIAGVVLLIGVTACLLLSPKGQQPIDNPKYPDLAEDFGFGQLYEVRGNIYAQFADGGTSYSGNADTCTLLRRYLAELSGATFSLTNNEEEETAFLGVKDLENYEAQFQLMCDYGGWFELDNEETAYIGHGRDDYYGVGAVWLVYPKRQAVYKCTDAAVSKELAKYTLELLSAPEKSLADTNKLSNEDFLAVRCQEPYEICTADRTYEEALGIFQDNYADFSKRYGTEKAGEIYDRYKGTCLEHKDSKIIDVRTDKISVDEKAVLFYFEYQRTFMNEIGSVLELWAGGGMDSETNDDGTTTYTEGQLGYIINDGGHWTYYAWSAVPADIDIDKYFT